MECRMFSRRIYHDLWEEGQRVHIAHQREDSKLLLLLDVRACIHGYNKRLSYAELFFYSSIAAGKTELSGQDSIH